MNPGSCVHFTGIQNKSCKRGFEYDSLSRPLPCIRSNTVHFPKERRGEQTPCVHSECSEYLAPTPEQLAEDERETAAWVARTLKGLRLASEWRTAKGWSKSNRVSAQEVVTCPVCNGRLHLSLAAYNGHVHGACETKGCIRWMQ